MSSSGGGLAPVALVSPRRKAGPSPGATETLGTAAWFQPLDLVQKYKFDTRRFQSHDILWDARGNGQVLIGDALDADSHLIGYRDDRHVCVVSGSRGGKGTSFIVPNLCVWPGSCLVIDPKGENATVTARRRGAGSDYCFGMGQAIKILDPFNVVTLDPSLKSRFNPLDTIDPSSEYAVDDAGLIAAALVPIQNSNDPFWERSARSLIQGVILHVLSHPDYKNSRNLVSVWRLIKQGDVVTRAVLEKTYDKKIPSNFELLWETMRRSKAFSGVVASTGEQMATMADRTGSGILKVASDALDFISGPPMQRVLEASDFDLSALKLDANGLSIYVTLPQQFMATHYGWLRLMVDLAAAEMERNPTKPATGYPTLFVLDEFAGLKRMETIENGAAQAAGAGVKYVYIVQNLPQIKETYKDSWETFLGNASLKLFFSIEDDFTRSYVSRQLGDVELRSRTGSGSLSASKGTSETRGTSVSDATGTTRSLSTGTSTTTSKTDSVGDNWSSGSSTSKGRSGSWGHGPGGFSGQSGNNSGTSTSLTKGGSTSKSFGESFGTSGSTTDGTSQSRTSGTSQSDSTNESISETKGWGESINRRPLMAPDEIGRYLARIDDEDDAAYPGLALALMAGHQPALVRRENYFQTSMLRGNFDPHPLHPETAPKTIAELLYKPPVLALPPPSSKPEIPAPQPQQKIQWLEYARTVFAIIALVFVGWLLWKLTAFTLALPGWLFGLAAGPVWGTRLDVFFWIGLVGWTTYYFMRHRKKLIADRATSAVPDRASSADP